MRLDNPARDRRLAEAVATLSEDERSRVAHSLLKVHGYFAARQDDYLEAVKAIVWALDSAEGRATPEAKRLRELIKGIVK
jgi:hypothetical protein